MSIANTVSDVAQSCMNGEAAELTKYLMYFFTFKSSTKLIIICMNIL